MDYKQLGQYELHQITLFKNGNEVDLSAVFSDIVLYESIFSNFMTATVTIMDTYDIVNQLPLDGEEMIVIEFDTTTANDPVLFEGMFYSVEEHDHNSESKAVVMHFISRPAYFNARKFEQGGYLATYGEIAAEVFKKIKSHDKNLIVEPTVGIKNMIFPTIRPAEAMNMMAKDAAGAGGTLGYVFYEDKRSFHFRSVHDMMTKAPRIGYRHGHGNVVVDVDKRVDEKFNVYQNYQVIEPAQFIDKVLGGYYGHNHGYFDVTSKEFVKYYESRDSTFANSLAPYPHRQTHPSSTQDRFVMTFVDTKEGDINVDQRTDLTMQSLDSFRAMFTVYGDSTVSAGETCECIIPIIAGAAMVDENNFYFGNFLITDIKHRLTQRKYMQTMTVMKDSFEETV